MRAKGFAKAGERALLVAADFDYEKKKGIYVFRAFDPEPEFEKLLDDLEGVVLFPNVTPVGDIFRRCDGVWLAFEDPVTRYLVSSVCDTVMAGGYPPLTEYAAAVLVERLKRRIGEREAIARVVFALTQAYATGALGEFPLSEFGYEPSETVEVTETGGERLSLYAGRLALWEVGEEGEAPHTLCCHAFRRLRAREGYEGFDGRSVANAIEYLSKLKGAKGHPHPARGEAAYEVALMLESGVLVFRDELPDPFPHT